MALIEMPRKRENAFCCGAGRGTKDAFSDFALWSAKQRLEEVKAVDAEAIVSTCPWCKNNFADCIKANGDTTAHYDIAEVIVKAIKD
jgi:Fe-S oxidoreductase